MPATGSRRSRTVSGFERLLGYAALLSAFGLWTPILAAIPVPVGTFSNVRTTEEHAYGNSLQLWRENGRLFGLYSVMDGLAGDPPVGLIERVRYNSRTGKLHFRAKLTTGIVTIAPGKERPAEDLFVFDGTLGDRALTGVLSHFDMLRRAAPPATESVRLAKVEGAEIFHPASYQEWKKLAREMLRRRGPRW